MFVCVCAVTEKARKRGKDGKGGGERQKEIKAANIRTIGNKIPELR